MKFVLGDIRHDKRGFSKLAGLNAQTEDCFLDEIEIDMKSTRWIDAEMCSALGAVTHRMADDLNSVQLINMIPVVQQILSKNGFLRFYGHSQVPDHWDTTISFSHFNVSEVRDFGQYVDTEFVNRPEMPEMSTGLTREFRKNLFELFSNSVVHANSHLGIFGCGQYYPSRKRLNFCLTDLGVGFRKNVCKFLNRNLEPEQAIDWATQGANTTKRGKIPGGLGLKLLIDFIDLNGGNIQIASDAGYWRRQHGSTFKANIRHPFPGTVVNIEINTSDPYSYQLSTERPI